METLIIKSDYLIRRTSLLPFRGKVLVHTGQHVAVNEVLAELELPEHFQVFDIVNNFKVEQDQLEKYVKRLVGEELKAGDVVAQKPGLISRIFRASQDGTIVSLREGKVTLALGKKKIQVLADLPGTITELIPDRGAVVGVRGSLLQGVWGNGLAASGLMASLNFDDEPAKSMGSSLEFAGKILFAENLQTLKQLEWIISQKAAGLILASIQAEFLSLLENLSIPVMSLIGFGDEAADPISKELLKEMEGSIVYLRASKPDPVGGTHPEVVLPREDAPVGNSPEETLRLEVGSLVRLLGRPYSGSVGTVIELPSAPLKFASGLTMEPVVVKRIDGEIVRVPYENLLFIVH